MAGTKDEEKADDTESSNPPFSEWNLDGVHACMGFPLRFMHKFIRSEYFYMIMIGACCVPSFVLSIYCGITVPTVRHLKSSDANNMNVSEMLKRGLEDGHLTMPEMKIVIVSSEQRCLNHLQNSEIPKGYCKGDHDVLWCWPHSKPGSVFLRCSESNNPDFPFPNEYARRVCESNGKWKMARNDQHMLQPWLDLKHCMQKFVWKSIEEQMLEKMKKNKRKEKRKEERKERKTKRNRKRNEIEKAKKLRKARFPDLTIATYIYQVGYASSIVTLILSIIILSKFRVLMCVRSVIHINMFTSFVLKAVMVFVVDGVRDNMFSHPKPTITNVTFDPNSISLPTYHMENFCKVVQVFYRYSLCTNYFWVLIEGLYLHNLMFVAFYPDRKFLTSYYVIGWGIPWLFVGPWTILRILKDDSRCWKSGNHWVEMIYQTPLFSAMILNLFLFFNMIRVLWSKMKSPPHTNKTQVTEDRNPYKKLLKSTLVCIPMFGAHQVLFMVVPVPPSSSWVYQLRMYWDTFFNSFQGCFVAIIYCLSNNEVLAEIKRCWNNIATEFQLSHNVRRRSRASITTLAGFSSTASQAPNANKDKEHNRELPTKVLVANEIPPKVEDTQLDKESEVKRWAACIRRTQDKKISLDEEVAIPLLPFKNQHREDDVISFDQELIDRIENKLEMAEAEDEVDLSSSAKTRAQKHLSMTIEEDGETSSQDDHRSMETEQEESDEQNDEKEQEEQEENSTTQEQNDEKEQEEQEEKSTTQEENEEKQEKNSTTQEENDEEEQEEKSTTQEENEEKQKENSTTQEENEEEQDEIEPKENLQNEKEDEQDEEEQGEAEEKREEVEEHLVGKYHRRAGVKQTDF